MQAAARAALGELARGLSTGAVVLAGSARCPPCTLSCAPCPDCVCGAAVGARLASRDDDVGGAAGLVVVFILGTCWGIAIVLFVLYFVSRRGQGSPRSKLVRSHSICQ